MRALLGAAGLIATLAIASPAPAAVVARYATPSPAVGALCHVADPCDVKMAIEGAQDGDEVIVLPGTYGATTPYGNPITVPHDNIFIHGVDGQPRPVIKFSTGDPEGIHLGHAGDRLSWLEVTNSGNGVWVDAGTSADHIVAHGAPGGSACTAIGTLTDSICVIDGSTSSSKAIVAGSPSATIHPVIRNVVGYVPGAATASAGLELSGSGGAHVTADVSNSIFIATTGVRSLSDGAGTPVTINIDHSNFATTATSVGGTINPGAGNQSAPPVFSDSLFHQALSSPTIDAGASDPANGTTDIDGDSRTLGARTDIGADEFQPVAPSADTAAVTGVAQTGATLNGHVNPGDAPTTFGFEYGLTPAYGRSTATQSAGGGTTLQAVSAVAGGLAPGTTYHYRIVASNSRGTATGSDMTFTTAPAPVTPFDSFSGLVLRSQTVLVKNGVASIAGACPAGTPGGCDGTLVLKTANGVIVPPRRAIAARKPRKKIVALGSSHFTIPAGQTRKIRVKITKSGLRLLKHGKVKAAATASAHDAAATQRNTRTRVTLKLAPKKKHH